MNSKNEFLEKSDEFVPFKICGHSEENINMAFDHLQKIIHGERIKDVLEVLKLSSRRLPKPPNFKEKSKPRINRKVEISSSRNRK
jgi:hypothetical protein